MPRKKQITRRTRINEQTSARGLEPRDHLLGDEGSLRALRPGLDEKLYENALLIELVNRGHRVHQQKSFAVHYEGHFIGKLVPDLIVDELVIVDPKVVENFHEDHIAQMLGYLAITDLELALLLNFKHAKLQWKRVIRQRSAEATELS